MKFFKKRGNPPAPDRKAPQQKGLNDHKESKPLLGILNEAALLLISEAIKAIFFNKKRK